MWGCFSRREECDSNVVAVKAVQAWVVARATAKEKLPSPIRRMRSVGEKGTVRA